MLYNRDSVKYFIIINRNRDGNGPSSVPEPSPPPRVVCLDTQLPTVTLPPTTQRDNPVQEQNNPDPSTADSDSDGDSEVFDENVPRKAFLPFFYCRLVVDYVL